MTAKKDETAFELEKRVGVADAELRALILTKTCDDIAKKKGYKGLSGHDVLLRYFADTYHWTPTQVRALTTEELSLFLRDFA